MSGALTVSSVEGGDWVHIMEEADGYRSAACLQYNSKENLQHSLLEW
jgi:hypothetical protein